MIREILNLYEPMELIGLRNAVLNFRRVLIFQAAIKNITEREIEYLTPCNKYALSKVIKSDL